MPVDGFGKRSRKIGRSRFQDLAGGKNQRRRILVAETVEQDPALAKAPRQESVVAMEAELNPSGVGLNSLHALDRYDFLDGRAELFVQIGKNVTMHADDAADHGLGNGLLAAGAHSIGRGRRQFGIDRKVFEQESGDADGREKLIQRLREVLGQVMQGQIHRGVAKRVPGVQIVIVGKCQRGRIAGPGFAIVVGKTQQRGLRPRTVQRVGESGNRGHAEINLIVA